MSKSSENLGQIWPRIWSKIAVWNVSNRLRGPPNSLLSYSPSHSEPFSAWGPKNSDPFMATPLALCRRHVLSTRSASLWLKCSRSEVALLQLKTPSARGCKDCEMEKPYRFVQKDALEGIWSRIGLPALETSNPSRFRALWTDSSRFGSIP